MKTLLLKVISPSECWIQENVHQVILPGAYGQLAVLPKHQDALVALSPGTLRISLKGGTNMDKYIGGGVAHISKNFCEIILY